MDAPTKEGYTFKGWYIANDLVEAPYVFEEDVVLVAKFDINMYTYKFIVEGAVVKEEVAEYGSKIEYPKTPSKSSTNEFSYVSTIIKNGDTGKCDCDYVLVISPGHSEYTALMKLIENVSVGNVVEFDDTLAFPVELTFKTE